jgi:membrane protein implicated in regulation of membrane protease activity
MPYVNLDDLVEVEKRARLLAIAAGIFISYLADLAIGVMFAFGPFQIGFVAIKAIVICACLVWRYRLRPKSRN